MDRKKGRVSNRITDQRREFKSMTMTYYTGTLHIDERARTPSGKRRWLMEKWLSLSVFLIEIERNTKIG